MARPSAECRALKIYKSSSFSVFFEQDWLQAVGPTSDRNYTMGLGFGLAGPMLNTWVDHSLLAKTERLVDRLVPGSPLRARNLEGVDRSRALSSLLSGTAFSPRDLRASAPLPNDRPYAFLLGWTASRTTALPQGEVAYASELTLGMIGSRAGRNVQRYIHKVLRNPPDDTLPVDPKGWGNQILDVPSVIFGWPTARYGFSRLSRPIARGPWFRSEQAGGPWTAELVWESGGEVGYYTSAFGGVRARIGYFSNPFWAWRQNPLDVGSRGPSQGTAKCLSIWFTCIDGFLYGGARGRAWLYNALLQGYPGVKDNTIPFREMRQFTHELNAGAVITLWKDASRGRGLQFTRELYAGRSPEFDGPFKRRHQWGGVFATFIW